MAVRSLRWVRSEAPFALCATLVVAGLITVASMHDEWRPGVAVVGAGLLAAGLLRLLLPAHRAGLLAVRARWWDVVCYLVMGGVIVALDIRLH